MRGEKFGKYTTGARAQNNDRIWTPPQLSALRSLCDEVTTAHYSQAELANLIRAVEQLCTTDCHKIPTTTWLRRKVN